MTGVGLKKSAAGIFELDIPEPRISQPDEMAVRIIETGIDGSDRNLVRHHLVDTPQSEDRLVLGHESWGVVEDTGAQVKNLRPGDHVALTVRRGCGLCAACANNQSDFCYTGLYKERGLHKLHGYLTSQTVEREQYLVPFSPEYDPIAVWTEPLAVVIKAFEQIRLMGSRAPSYCPHPHHAWESDEWGGCKKGVVIGAGPLGFLATLVMVLEGVDTYVVEVVPSDNARVKMIKRAGAKYVDGNAFAPAEIIKGLDRVDLVFEASGASEYALSFIPQLSRNSIYMLTGVPRVSEKQSLIDPDLILRQIVRHNLALIGSVNANAGHFREAIKLFPRIQERFGDILHDAITWRGGLADYQAGFAALNDPEHIKVLFEIAKK